ncbi:G-patch domain protein [Kalmanozyma brasiliensis GHG001]|uniref:G-patch domain protein n=1 Tax=Kalmanozyma brasiliensis (strain GHG001) TaxID=1365824 RepID=UPI0028682E14|nr:G-patch domain protein [Kalmanozyma brasiliensis GHG001]KAF6767106.1 G-patch domain protein [Kalmanozyma brasiliensis GHG001]
MQDTPRRLTRIPRRLSNAPRWKKIAGDNVGHSLLSRMGWKEGMGLGVQEWKWQQLRREKEKRLRSAAVRSLLLRQGSGDQQRGSELQPSMPFALELRDREEQRIAAEAWLSGLVGPEAEWIQTMMLNERQLLQQALISGQVTIKDLQEALSIDADGFSPALFGSLQPNEAMPIDEALTEAQDDDALQSDALLYPVEVELRSDRRGIGVKRSSTDALSGAHQRRRSRAAEGSVEIRRQSPGSNETLAKRIRPTSAGRPFRSPTRSRSRSGAGASGRSETQAELTRRQREQAYQRDKRDWLDLRASLS